MWTVLIFLNLGAVHCTVSSSLPSPINVTFSSLNLWNKLQWFPGRDTPEDANFKVQYAIYGDNIKTPKGRKVNWRPVPRCTGTARTWCDLTNETWDLEHEYSARVRAVSRGQFSSSWTRVKKRFHPKADTSFGPPLVSVEIGDSNAVVITLKGPTRHQPHNHAPAVSMATLYPQMIYMLSVENTRRGTTLHVRMDSDSYKYQLMEYDTEYCFSATTKFLSMPAQCLSSAPHCVTTPQDPVIGQLLSAVVGIVVPSVCMFMVGVVGYLLHNYLTGKGQKSPHILNQPPFHRPDLLSSNHMDIGIIKEIRPESDKPDAESSGYASRRPPGYAAQGWETPQPSADWSADYGCVVARAEAPPSQAREPLPSVPGGETPQSGLYRVRLNPPANEGVDGSGRPRTGGETGRGAREGGEDEEVPLLSTSSASDRSELLPDDYGVVRTASENYEEEEEEEEEEECKGICIDWNPETGKLVLPQMDGLMEEEEEEEEEEVELRLENVYVRQGSDEKAEAQREMEGGGGTELEVEDFSKRWNLAVL
ncbi:il20ra [Pungitius sinensis]